MGVKWNELYVNPKERTSQVLARAIKELIFDGRLQPNEKLPPERTLAQELGTSRTSVREAILSLEQSGLIKIQRGNRGGFFVSEPSSQVCAETLNDQLRLGKIDIHTITDARLIIEPSTAGVAAIRRTPQQLNRIESALTDYQERIVARARRSLSDFEFHVAVAEASGNLVMVMMISSLMELLYETVSQFSLPFEQQKKVSNHHQTIFDAIRIKDQNLAFTEMKRHVQEMVGLWQNKANNQ